MTRCLTALRETEKMKVESENETALHETEQKRKGKWPDSANALSPPFSERSNAGDFKSSSKGLTFSGAWARIDMISATCSWRAENKEKWCERKSGARLGRWLTVGAK